MKRLFEWGIHRGANLATFYCVLRVTWCHCVRFSCYFRPNGATINVSNFKVLTSRLFPHIRCCFVEPCVNSPKFTQDSLQIQGSEFRTKFVRNSYELRTGFVPCVPLCTLSLSCSPLIAFRYLIMSQMLSQLASLQSTPDAAADTLARYEALPVAHHQMEEATYNSGPLVVEEVVAWAASLDLPLEVIHIDLRSPSRNSYLGGKAWSTEFWRELHFRVPSLRFLHLLPIPATMDQSLNAMRTGGEDQGHPHLGLPHH